MKNTAAQSPISRRLFWLASAMFFLSGGTGLAYQVIWFKRFSHVWGSSSLAFAAVGGSFLFGLGLGAYLIGRIADRIRRPLAWYGVCELAIGLVALAIPYAIQGLISLSAAFYSQLPAEPLVRFLVQFAVTLVVIGPPCVLMGGTLPLLTRELTARDGALDQATGWLYAINTYGAAAGCYLAGFQLLPALGLVLTNNLAAGLNITIGLAALWLGRGATGPSTAPGVSRTSAASSSGGGQPPEHGAFLLSLYVAVALSGLAALVLEMTWSRQLALAPGGSTYAYSATLFVVLVGIASGSLLFHLRARGATSDRYLLVAVIFGLAVTSFAGKLFLPWLSTFAGDHRAIRGTLVGNAGLCVLVAAIVEFLPAVAMGMLFPLFVDLTHERAARVGHAVGNIYAWNTFGSLAGATLTGVLLFPRIGTAGAMGVAIALYLVAMLLVLPHGTARERTTAVGCAVVLGAIVFGISLPIDPLRTNMGQYMYGSQEGIIESMRCAYYVDGPSSSVAVVTFGDVASLRINGKADAGNSLDMLTQVGLAYLPRLLCPAAKDVMVIGFGSGTTSGSALLFPGTRVTACDIEPAVFGAEPFFESVNHRPLERTRAFLEKQNETLPADRRHSPEQIDEHATLRVVTSDGRSQLQGDGQKYDLIISEPSNPWIAGISNLFTQEFFSVAKSRLKPGGVLAQWIQTYNISLTDYLMIVRTMRTVFPHCGLLTLTAGADTLLVASDQQLVPDPTELDELQKAVDATADISADWQKWFNTTDVRTLLLARYTADQEMLDQMTAKDSSKRLNTDLNLLLEFHAPLHLFQDLPDALSARQRLARLPHDRWTARLGEQIGVPADSAVYQVAVALEQMELEQLDAAVVTLQQVVVADPQQSQAYRALANIYLKQNKPQDALQILETWIQKQPDRFEARAALFNMYRSLGRGADAVAIFQPLVEKDPDNAAFHVMLGQQLLALHRNAEATRELRQALALEPELADTAQNRDWVNTYARLLAAGSGERDGAEALRWAQHLTRNVDYDQWSLIDTLAAAYAEVGQFDNAIAQMQKVLERAQADGDPNGAEMARRRLSLYKAGEPLREQDEPAAFKP